MRKILIVGNSHTVCIKAAAKNVQNVKVVNARVDDMASTEMEAFGPDVVALAFRGNAHNVLSLFEHPVPFTSGGLLDDVGDRVSIPLMQIRDVMNAQVEGMRVDTGRMHKRFPNADFVYICAPPPLEITAAVTNIPRTFRGVMKNGVAPSDVRLLFYDVQTEFFQDLAKHNGAGFIFPPQQALTSEGLLASNYCSNDPTHANIEYGKLVLQQVIDWAEAV